MESLLFFEYEMENPLSLKQQLRASKCVGE